MSKSYYTIIDGHVVWVKVCPPSRRKSLSSIQRTIRQNRARAGALWAALERNLKILKED